MRASGGTYSDLKEAGMTHETMGLFPFTLQEWGTLRFSRTGAEAVPAHVLERLFGMTNGCVAVPGLDWASHTIGTRRGVSRSPKSDFAPSLMWRDMATALLH